MSKLVLEELRKTPDLKKVIKVILDKKFIHTDKIADIIASAIYAKQNVILYGSGGHGKSEMVECVLEGLGLWNKNDPSNSATLVQSFGEGLTEDALWGGIDFKKLNNPTNPEMWFNVENSFLNYPVAVFEELFDAPAFCLLPLKHTLQAGFLAKNGKSYPMQTEIIIACTNRSPDEIAEMGETYRALLERFVLRQEVIWPRYDIATYLKLIDKHPQIHRFSGELQNSFASICANCFESGDFISPRTAMKAIDVICGSATSNNRLEVQSSDLYSLTNVAGFGRAANNIKTDLENIIRHAKAETEMSIFIKEYEELINQLDNGVPRKVIEFCIFAKKFLNLQSLFSNIFVPDNLYDKRSSYIKACEEKYQSCMSSAISKTNI